MRRGRWAWFALGIAIVVTSAVVVGHGRSGANALALDPVAAAATKTQDAGAAHVSFALAFKTPQLPGGKMLHLHGAGAIDGASAELTFDMGSFLHQAGAQGGGQMKEILLEQHGDYVVYIRFGLLAAHLPGGKPWIALDLTKLGKSAGIDLGTLLSGSQLEPTDLLSMLKAEGAKIQKVGPATIEGTATTHYRVTVDVAKALEAKGLTSPLLSGVAAQIGTIPEDVWIGHDGLVHRISLSYGLARTHVEMTMDLSDYGANVTIAAPPSSDVFDATAMAEQGLAHAGSITG